MGIDTLKSWVNFYYLDNEMPYDYKLVFIIKNIYISPDYTDYNDYTETKTIEDGFEYVKDDNGNVLKDTLGNEIKVAKYKDIQCHVIETFQEKTANIEGYVEIYSGNELTISDGLPISASYVYEHQSATYTGDINALSAQSYSRVRSMSSFSDIFPSNFWMADRCFDEFQRTMVYFIYRNIELLGGE